MRTYFLRKTTARRMKHNLEKGDNMFARTSLGLLIFSLLLAGCTKSTNPLSSSATSGNVTMSVSFTNPLMATSSGNLNTVDAVTPIRIDSAVVVLAGIKFESNIDSVQVDSSGDSPLLYINASDPSVIFRGPFVIHVRDTVAINFASQTLPAGTYTGVKFAIKRLDRGQSYHDSDHFNNGIMPPDTSVQNYSIVVWGAIYKDTSWVPFEFKDNQNLEFKVPGNITIANSTSSIKVALNFNMGSWFTDPSTGATLDPTDMSFQNQLRIQQAIRASFGDGRCEHEQEQHRNGQDN